MIQKARTWETFQSGEMRQFKIHLAKFLFRKHGQQVEQQLIFLKFLLYSYFCIIIHNSIKEEDSL